MRLLLLLLLALPAILSAQYADLKIINLGDHSFHLEWTMGAAGLVSVQYAMTSPAVPAPTYETLKLGGTGGLDAHSNVAGLAAATTYYFRAVTSGTDGDMPTCAVTCTNCGSGDGFPDNSQINCTTGEYPRVTTLAEAGPETPTAPTHDPINTAVWTITGSTFVAATCLQLQIQMDAAAAQAVIDGLIHQVRGPTAASGGPCYGRFLMAATGTGRVEVRPDVDDALLPPPGMETDLLFRPYALRMSYPIASADVDWLGRNSYPLLEAPATTANWRFTAVEFSPPDHSLIPVRQFDIDNIAGDTITTTVPHGLAAFEKVRLDVPGAPYESPDGQAENNTRIASVSVPSGSTFRAFNWDFTGYSGGGKVTAADPSIALASCANTTPITCDTVNPHGLGIITPKDITAISDKVITVPSPIGHWAGGGNSVKITGSPAGTWDGTDYFSSRSGDDFTLAGAYSGTCPGPTGCGQAVRLFVIQIQGTGNAALDGPHVFSVVDADTIQLEQTTAVGATTGGYAAYDPSQINRMIELNDVTNWSCDRCFFISDSPYRVFFWLSGSNVTGVAVFDSYTAGASMWVPNNPWSNEYGGESSTALSDAGRFFGFDTSSATDIQLLRTTTTRSSGITLYAGEGAGTPQNWTIDKWKWYRPLSMISGYPGQSEGPAYLFANTIEFKTAQIVSITGSYFFGNQNGGFVPRAPVLNMSNRENAGGLMEDFRFDFNVCDLCGGAGVISGSGDFSDRHTLVTQRLSISNNLFAENDYDALLTNSPSIGTGSAGGGYPIVLGWEMEWAAISNNTWWINRGHGPFLMGFDRSRMTGLTFTDNILHESRNTNSPPWSGVFALGEAPFTPYTAGTADVSIDVHWRAEPNTDPHTSVTGNIVIPGVKDPSSGDFEAKRDSTDSADKASAAEVATAWGTYSQTNIDAATVRLAEQIVYGTDDDWVPEAPYAGKGVDINALLDAQGYTRDVAFTDPAPGQLQVNYTAPSTVACVVRVSTDLDWATPGAITEQTDAGGAASRQVTFNGLSGRYASALWCQGGTALRNAFTIQ